MTQRFKIGSKVYSVAAIDDISLRDALLFANQVAELGLTYTWSDVERINAELADMTEEQAQEHPDGPFMTAITIWLGRRAAGEDVTISQAIDVPVSSIDFLADPTDRKPGKKAVKKAAKKAPRPASGQASDDAPQ